MSGNNINGDAPAGDRLPPPAFPRGRRRWRVPAPPPDANPPFEADLSPAEAAPQSLNDDVEVFRFPDECTMMQAQAALTAEGAAPEVIRTGPVVSQNPLAFLSGQIVIRFRRSSRPDPDATTLLAGYGLVRLRDLTYVDRGKLYAAPVPSYALYDLARQHPGFWPARARCRKGQAAAGV